MPLWEIFGWTGSILVVVSLMVPSLRKFRILNLTGSAIATIYNVYFEIWPYAAMNAAIVAVNVYWLWRLSREGETEQKGYSVVEVDSDNAILRRFLVRNGASIRQAYPNFTDDGLVGATSFLVMHEEEVIGLFAVRHSQTCRGEIVLDYVTERFRDLAPGRFIYDNAELFQDYGLDTLTIRAEDTTDPGYFEKEGFTESAGVLQRSL